MAVFNVNRTFGVEIEFKTTLPSGSVVWAINSTDFVTATNETNSYTTHEAPSGWKLVTDGSVYNEGAYSGFELVSPILSGTNGLDQLKAVLSTMEGPNYKVDRQCGIHIHHGIEDLTGEQIGLSFGLYGAYQKVINYLVSPSRRNGQYTKEVDWNLVTDGGTEKFKGNSRTEATSKIKRKFGCFCGINTRCRCTNARYHSMNPLSILTNNTIEFRQHHGTLSYDKISNWILLTQSIIETAKETKTFPKATWLRSTISKKEGNFYRLKGATRYTPKGNPKHTPEQCEKYSEMWKFYSKVFVKFAVQDHVPIEEVGKTSWD